MPRNRPFRKLSIDEDLCKALEQKKAGLLRAEDLTPFVEWVLRLYVNDQMIPIDLFRKQIEDEIRAQSEVHTPDSVSVKAVRVGSAEHGHDNRKAS